MRISSLLLACLLVFHGGQVLAAPAKSQRPSGSFEYTPSDSTFAYEVLSIVAQGGISLVDWARSGRSMSTRLGTVAAGCTPYLSSDKHVAALANVRALQNIAIAHAGVQVSGYETLSTGAGYGTSASASSVTSVGETKVLYSRIIMHRGHPHNCVLLLESHDQDG